MKRVLTVLLLAAGLGLSAGRGEAQVQIQIGNASDSAVVVLSGATTSLLVSAYRLPYNWSACYYAPYYFYSEYCLTYAQLTFVYDPTRIDSIGAEPTSPGLATLSATSPASGRFTVTASGGVGGYQAQLFRLRIKLAAGASDGGYLWVRVDSLAAPYDNDVARFNGGARSLAAQVCHATDSWGDVDGNSRVDSRDALITLSAAVGLPVSGFNLALGDVDQDGLTNSRDALMMLSYAIALPIYQTNRIGVGIADACPGLTPPGETVVFQRSQASGGGIFRLDSLSTIPEQLTTVQTDLLPRLNATGTRVAFQCWDPVPVTQVCLVDLAGTNRRLLTGPGSPYHARPDWSPDGTKLAYIQDNNGVPVLSTMDSSGASQFPVGAVGGVYGPVVWSHAGSRLAYRGWGSGIISTVTMDTVHTVVSLVEYAAGLVSWSPGDTLVAYQQNVGDPIWSIPASGGTPRPLATIEGVQDFDWGPVGIVFSMAASGSSYPSLWLLKGGPAGTLVRLTAPGSTDADRQPSFRRAP